MNFKYQIIKDKQTHKSKSFSKCVDAIKEQSYNNKFYTNIMRIMRFIIIYFFVFCYQ